VGKLGLYLPRTLSRAISVNNTEASFSRSQLPTHDNTGANTPNTTFPRPTWRIGGSIIPSRSKRQSMEVSGSRGDSGRQSPSREQASSTSLASEKRGAFLKDSAGGLLQNHEPSGVRSPLARQIRFPDEDEISGEQSPAQISPQSEVDGLHTEEKSHDGHSEKHVGKV
jgi:hypothetical protein